MTKRKWAHRKDGTHNVPALQAKPDGSEKPAGAQGIDGITRTCSVQQDEGT